MKIFFLIITCFIVFSASAQEVNKEFTRLLFNENFDQADENWSSTFNSDNLFITQNGYYELYRKSKKSGYYLFHASSKVYTSFKLESSLVFSDHKNKKQSAGLVMMAHPETGGGLMVEINQKREYRIVRVYKDRQVPLSGGSGWVKASSYISKAENSITIKSYDKVYDLYINNHFIQSFTDIELNKGQIGLYVGPDSKVKFDFLRIHGEDIKDLQDLEPKGEKEIEQSFAQIIVKLKDQIIKKDREIDELKTKIKLCESSGSGGVKTIDTSVINDRNRLRMQLIESEEENEDLALKLISAERELEELKAFKASIEKSAEEGDIIINLTNMVTTQKEKIEALENKNKSLNSENNSLFMETKDLTKQLDRRTVELSNSQENSQILNSEIDSLKAVILSLRDTIKANKEANEPDEYKGLTEDEKLQKMIEKEREQRRKQREEEEQRKKDEAEKKD